MVWNFLESISPSKIKPIIGPYFYPNNILPSGGADPQDWQYLEYSMPGAVSRRMTNTRVCDPLWPVFGCKTSDEIGEHTAVVPKNELPPQYQAEEENADLDLSAMSDIEQLSMMTGYSTFTVYGLTIVGFGVFMVGAGRLLKWVEDNEEV